jgi:hypothetical protein
MGRAPKSLPLLGLAIGPHPTATAVTKPWHLSTQIETHKQAEQLKLNKTDPSMWP